MTQPLPPDPARFSALLAPPRRHHLAVCLRDTTALSPPLFVLAAMLVSLAQGIFSRTTFPQAVWRPVAADPSPQPPRRTRRRAARQHPCPAECPRRRPRHRRTPAGGCAGRSGGKTPCPAAASRHRHGPDATDRHRHGAAASSTACPAANPRAASLTHPTAHLRRRAAGRCARMAIPPAQRQPRPLEERRAGRRLPRGAALRCSHPRRRKLPATGHAQRPLPPAWRQEHRSTHRSRPRTPPPHPHPAWRLRPGRSGLVSSRGCLHRRDEAVHGGKPPHERHRGGGAAGRRRPIRTECLPCRAVAAKAGRCLKCIAERGDCGPPSTNPARPRPHGRRHETARRHRPAAPALLLPRVTATQVAAHHSPVQATPSRRADR